VARHGLGLCGQPARLERLHEIRHGLALDADAAAEDVVSDLERERHDPDPVAVIIFDLVEQARQRGAELAHVDEDRPPQPRVQGTANLDGRAEGRRQRDRGRDPPVLVGRHDHRGLFLNQVDKGLVFAHEPVPELLLLDRVGENEKVDAEVNVAPRGLVHLELAHVARVRVVEHHVSRQPVQLPVKLGLVQHAHVHADPRRARWHGARRGR
jgi:hypothetical protein